MTGYGYGGGASMWGFGVLMMVVLIGLVVWAVVAATSRGNRGRVDSEMEPAQFGGRSPTRQTLDERYARGEMNSAEYTERLHTMGL